MNSVKFKRLQTITPSRRNFGVHQKVILSAVLPASCFCGLSLAPVSWSSVGHISPSCPNTLPEQCSYGPRRNGEDKQKDRWKTCTHPFPMKLSHSSIKRFTVSCLQLLSSVLLCGLAKKSLQREAGWRDTGALAI